MTFYGVFLLSLLVVANSVSANEMGIHGEIGQGEFLIDWDFSLELSAENQLNGTLQVLSGREYAFTDGTFEHRGRIGRVNLYYNAPYLTSSDPFRFMHGTNYSADTTVFHYSNPEATRQLVIADSIPAHEGPPASGIYYHQQRGDFEEALLFFDSGNRWWQFEEGRYDFYQHRGIFGSAKYHLAYPGGDLSLALGHTIGEKQFLGDKDELAGSAWAINNTGQLRNLRYRLELSDTGPEYRPPFTTTLPYKPGERGVRSTWNWKLSMLDVRFYWNEYRQSSGEASSRREVRLRFGKAVVSLRYRPSERLVLGANNSTTSWEWVLDTQRMRIDTHLQNHKLIFMFKPFGTFRFEHELVGAFNTTFVFKQSPIKGTYIYAHAQFGSAKRFWRLAYGQWDRRNLDALFSQEPRWSVGFSYLF